MKITEGCADKKVVWSKQVAKGIAQNGTISLGRREITSALNDGSVEVRHKQLVDDREHNIDLKVA